MRRRCVGRATAEMKSVRPCTLISATRSLPKTLIAWLLLASAFAVTQAAVAAEPLGNDVCLSCHATAGLEKERQGKKISLAVDAQRFSKCVHGALPCKGTLRLTEFGTSGRAGDVQVSCDECHRRRRLTFRSHHTGPTNR